MPVDGAISIHPAAIVHPAAGIGKNVQIGAYSVVGPEVILGDGSVVGHHVVLEGRIQAGLRVKIGHGSVIGSPPQDLKFKEETPSGVLIDDDTVIREHVTIHRATREDGWTRIGSESLIMASSHIAHDCTIGDHAIIINYAGITGHVSVGNYATVGGLTGIAPFTRVGAYAYIGGCSRVTQDVPPYVIVAGVPALAQGVNVVGLRRAGIGPEVRRVIRQAFRILYRSGLSPRSAADRIRAEISPSPFTDHLIDFIESSKRGICGGARGPADREAEGASVAGEMGEF